MISIVKRLAFSNLFACLFVFISEPNLIAESRVRFNEDVRPILSEYCYACHGFDHRKREAGLRLDTEEGSRAKLDSGEVAIAPGFPETSELIKRIVSDDEGSVMPPPESGKKLTDAQRATLKTWIEQGAVYEPHWAFIPPKKPSLPSVSNQSDETLNPIDLFIREKLAKVGLEPSAIAPPYTLLRRVSLDLTGLPPTSTEVESFEADFRLRGLVAYRKLVDRLLDKPGYGERWGRWWLDQARYADSNGYSIDAPREIWKYRDWVVEAFNIDMPFDQFTIEQLAGDLLLDASQSQKIATGFHRNTQINQEGGIDPEQFRIESVFDRVATTGAVFLGLTIGCAQCHDHKFDPILQKEYYQLFAFFNSQDEPTLKVYGEGENVPELNAKIKESEKALQNHIASRMSAFEAWEAKLTAEQKSKMSASLRKALKLPTDKRSQSQQRDLFNVEVGKIDSEYQSLLQNFSELDNRLRGIATTMVLQERKEPRETYRFINGDFTRPAEQVAPATPAVLHRFSSRTSQPNRYDLAQWIVSPSNPLTARVIVNRVWQQYFGRGIVESDNDFGLQGALPTHSELLDWLATEFVENKWSLKKLHCQIVSSATYMQMSHDRSDLKEKDKDNYLLARQRRLRLDAEIVRDVGLFASGLLSPKMGGAPVFPPIPDGVMTQGQVKRQWKTSQGDDRYRRGLYTFVYRATPPPSLNVFDAPEGISSCTRRFRSNTPLQALALLNDTAFVEFAQSLKKIVETQGVAAAFQRCTARQPTPNELVVLNKLDSLSLARVLLNLDETVTRE